MTEDFVEDVGEIGTELRDKGRKVVEEGKTNVSEIVGIGRKKYSNIFRKQEKPVDSVEE